MRDSDRQSGFPAVRSPFQGRRGDKPRRLQTSWWVRASAALVICAAAVAASYAQTFTTLDSFNGADGAFALAPLMQGSDGNLYGTTVDGGANSCIINGVDYGCGTVFTITPGGRLKTLYSFCSQSGCSDGSFPEAGLAQGADGSLYGTTCGGDCGDGVSGAGTVFKMTPSGVLTTLYSFCSQNGCSDGNAPLAGVIRGVDGNFYGTTYGGGSGGYCPAGYGGCGTVFKVSPSGTLTTLYSFCSQSGCTDGLTPMAALVQAADGNLYGTTIEGGSNVNNAICPSGCGTIFRLKPTGTLKTIYSFCLQTNCTDGAVPVASLVQDGKGNLYGTTTIGGSSNSGTVFEMTLGATLTTIYSFCSQTNCTDGSQPDAALVQGSDGNFYGTTQYGGANCKSYSGCGTIFELTPVGKLTTLHTFDGADGYFPYAPLVQDTNGELYGTTWFGGANEDGTAFSLSVDLGPFVKARPTFGRAGATVRILGTDLTGATSVTFNGTPATFTVVLASLITTTVPSGATTGTVQVVTPGGTLSSNVPFRVIE